MINKTNITLDVDDQKPVEPDRQQLNDTTMDALIPDNQETINIV